MIKYNSLDLHSGVTYGNTLEPDVELMQLKE